MLVKKHSELFKIKWVWKIEATQLDPSQLSRWGSNSEFRVAELLCQWTKNNFSQIEPTGDNWILEDNSGQIDRGKLNFWI